MRRVIGLVLAGLGILLIAAGVLTRTVVAGQVIKFPLSEHLVTTLRGNGMSFFSTTLLREVPDGTMRVTSTVNGDAAAGTSSTAVWKVSTSLYDVTDSRPYLSTARRVAFNRRTAGLVGCCGASVGGNTAIRQSGLVGFLWPFGTQKRTYQVFDVNLDRAVPARYAGTSTVGGISVYRFAERVATTRAGSQKLPGALIGLPSQPLVTLPEFYTATITFWVDPRTGAQLNVSENEKLALDDAAGAQRLLLFDGDLRMTPGSVRTVVGLDRSGRTEYGWLVNIIPLLGLIAGLAALIAGLALARSAQQQAGGELEVVGHVVG